LLSLSGYRSFVSPPEGDPDRRWIIFVEKILMVRVKSVK
jgi:hypothetical protein